MTGLYFIYNNKVNIPFQLKIINEYNEEIISDKYYEIKNLFILNNQFSCINNYKEFSINQDNLNLNFDCN